MLELQARLRAPRDAACAVQGVHRAQRGAPEAFEPFLAHRLARRRAAFARRLDQHGGHAALVERALFAHREGKGEMRDLPQHARRRRPRASLPRDRVANRPLQG